MSLGQVPYYSHPRHKWLDEAVTLQGIDDAHHREGWRAESQLTEVVCPPYESRMSKLLSLHAKL